MPTMSGTQKVTRHPGIYSYATKAGRRYAAVATVLGQQRWSRGHRTITEAEEAKAALRMSLKTGRSAKAAPTMTLMDYLRNQWLPSLEVKASSLRAYQLDLDRIEKALGSTLRLSAITPFHVETFKQKLRESGLGSTSQVGTYWRLSQALRKAVRWQLIPSNPCDLADAPRRERYRPAQLEVEDVKRLLSVADATPWGPLVYLAVATGMREGELFALKWSDVDMSDGLVRVTESKTDAGVRAVALGPLTMERLRRHRLEQMRRFTQLGADPPALVFLNLDGAPMSQAPFWAHWNRIRVAAALPKLHFHDLRHAQATLLARAGVHPSISQRRLGHSDSKLTLDVYTHTSARDQIGAAAAVEGLLG